MRTRPITKNTCAAASPWTLGNAESVAETCASLGVDIATAPAPDNPARVAAAAKAATKATTHGVAAAAGNRP
mgnify:FL=1